MAKLNWDREPDGSLRTIGDDTGCEFKIETGITGGLLLFVDDTALPYGFETVEDAQEEAQGIEDRTDVPDVTEGVGYAENH